MKWNFKFLFNSPLGQKEERMEMTQDKVTINGVEYVRKGLDQIEHSGDIKIVVLQRGWIMVGRFERNGQDCKLHNASVIRRWGTTKGLGEIASGGPTSSTILDKCGGVVGFDYLTVVHTLDCNEAKWKSAL